MEHARDARPPGPPAEPPELPKPADPGQVEALARRLHDLWDLVGQTNQQWLDALVQREQGQRQQLPPAAAATDQAYLRAALDDLRSKLDRLLERIPERPAAAPVVAELVPAPTKADDEAQRAFFRLIRQKLESLELHAETIQARLQRPADVARPAPESAPPAPRLAAGGGPEPLESIAWQRAVLGTELSADPQLETPRRRLVDALIQGHPEARCLAGQLLIFQGSPPEKLPTLLKEIGEAFYRWQPKSRPGASPLETALAHWVHQRCLAAGINNSIELVNPGERFDAQRHTSTTRGVEIVDVQGWIVLRDTGKVYTKAAVRVT